MNCQTCNNELIKNGSYCKNCKTIVNSENLPKTPVDKKSSWYSLEMLAFVFFSPKGRLNRTRYWGSLFLGGVVL